MWIYNLYANQDPRKKFRNIQKKTGPHDKKSGLE